MRALLVALHIAAVALMAFPAPGGGMNRSAWRDPTVQGEFKAWTGRLNSVGVQITQDELEDRLWIFAIGYMDARNGLLDPIKPYYRYTGAWQSWRMFVAPHRYPAKLHIDLEVDGVWQPLYVQRDPEADWKSSVLDNDRMRSALFRYSWRHYRAHYRNLCNWLAARAKEDFPEATRLRVRYFKYETPSPQQVKTGTQPVGKFQQLRVLELR